MNEIISENNSFTEKPQNASRLFRRYDQFNIFFLCTKSKVFRIADVVGINMPNLKILKIC